MKAGWCVEEDVLSLNNKTLFIQEYIRMTTVPRVTPARKRSGNSRGKSLL